MVRSVLCSQGYCPGNLPSDLRLLTLHEGPYAPAVLRFRIEFPTRYPTKPPLIIFTSDIFHPLVTPLTTYTFTTGSQQSETVSAGDDDRLPPGGFSLRHGFPPWFSKADLGASAAEFRSSVSPLHKDDRMHFSRSEHVDHAARGVLQHGATNESSLVSVRIWDVLTYMKSCFDNESVLDNLPLAEAANDRAWKAWQAHRKNKPGIAGSNTVKDQRSHRVNIGSSTVFHSVSPQGSSKIPDDWNWDGVWQDRVREGINNSISKPVLFGTGGDEPVSMLHNDCWTSRADHYS